MKTTPPFFVLLLLLCSWTLQLAAQPHRPDRIPGELIVRLAPGVQLQPWLEEINGSGRAPAALAWHKTLDATHNFHLLRLPDAQLPQALAHLQRRPEVLAAQYNYRVQPRGERTPNDPLYTDQWGPPQIALPQVWDITTGGVTARGDTIVVAVLDEGFDNLDHPDLIPNLWQNRGEIPGDGLDNDGNGYADDRYGWNFMTNRPDFPGGGHGLSVAGIIGARADNGQGVAGVNWHVKLMVLQVDRVDEIIAGYAYVIDQRRRYNQSLGQEGAFVVATNASFGQSRIFCAQQPAWAAMYDLLGEVGVLTGAGTDNSPHDVDELGDMPTTCPSEYLIATLNTTPDDRVAQSSAYGATSIDLGSPGDETFTIRPFGGYGNFGGNSAAAPHLTGAIALLYSLPCPGLAQDALSNPAAAARFVRRALLQGVDPVQRLAGKTATGGRLNVFGAMEIIQQDCGTTTGPLQILNTFPNPVDTWLSLTYEAPDFEPFELLLFDALGRTVHRAELRAPRFGDKREEIDLSRLAPGTYFLRLTKASQTVATKIVVQ